MLLFLSLPPQKVRKYVFICLYSGDFFASRSLVSLFLGSTCRMGSLRRSIYDRLSTATTWHYATSTIELRPPPRTAHAQNVTKEKGVTKRKGNKLEGSEVLFFLFVFRTLHHCHFSFFLSEHCECYFRWHFVANFTFDMYGFESQLNCNCRVQKNHVFITITLNSAAAFRQKEGLGL